MKRKRGLPKARTTSHVQKSQSGRGRLCRTVHENKLANGNGIKKGGSKGLWKIAGFTGRPGRSTSREKYSIQTRGREWTGRKHQLKVKKEEGRRDLRKKGGWELHIRGKGSLREPKAYLRHGGWALPFLDQIERGRGEGIVLYSRTFKTTGVCQTLVDTYAVSLKP